MESILEKMFYENFRLKNNSMKYQKELCALSELVKRSEQELSARLSDEERNLFENYRSNTDELSMLECCDEFLQGFRFGSRIIMEIVFGADDAELQT